MTISLLNWFLSSKCLLLTGILGGKNSNSLKVSFELNSINLELSYYYPGSPNRHDSANQTQFQIINQGPKKDLHDLSCWINHHILTTVSGVGLSPTRGRCETSQVLLAGVPGGFSWGSPIFGPPTDWPVSYEPK